MQATVHEIDRLALSCDRWRWPFAENRRHDIDAHFAQLRAEKPGLWNGRVLLGRAPRFSDGAFAAAFFETDFASFVAWRDWDFPDRSVFNGFGMGVLRSRDGAFVLGEMGPGTVSAGRIYFPGGTPDPEDVKDGALDVVGSIERELAEETGLQPHQYRRRRGWICVDCGVMIAILAVCDVDLDAAALKAAIERNIAAQDKPELAGIHMLRSENELTHAMPAFVGGFIRHYTGRP